jgi:hypothetical protein
MAGENITIHVEFVGFPKIYDLFQGDRIELSFSGNTLMSLIESLFSDYGQCVREGLWDEKKDGLDPSIQIVINQEYTTCADLHRITVSQGDRVTFLKLLAGG